MRGLDLKMLKTTKKQNLFSNCKGPFLTCGKLRNDYTFVGTRFYRLSEYSIKFPFILNLIGVSWYLNEAIQKVYHNENRYLFPEWGWKCAKSGSKFFRIQLNLGSCHPSPHTHTQTHTSPVATGLIPGDNDPESFLLILYTQQLKRIMICSNFLK